VNSGEFTDAELDALADSGEAHRIAEFQQACQAIGQMVYLAQRCCLLNWLGVKLISIDSN
jgi:hypothetical protein